MNKPKKILLNRNDKLGDFMLAWPAFDMIRRSLADVEIHALVPSYTKAMAEQCPSVDKLIIDPGPERNGELIGTLKRENYDAIISYFSTTRIGWAAWRAGIPVRVAPATKFAQIFYNHKLTQRRSQSTKAEFEYNNDLSAHYLSLLSQSVISSDRPFLWFEQNEIDELKKQFRLLYQFNDKNIVFIHPGHGGSANNLSPHCYEQLARLLLQQSDCNIAFTAGPDEVHIAEPLVKNLAGEFPGRVCLYHSQQGLLNFAKHIAFCDCFVSGSTGPLHLAGALDRPTCGFYPRGRVTSITRWRTINSQSHQLNFAPAQDQDENAMDSIDVAEVGKAILLQLVA